jgi:hypothetical protein
VPRRNRQKLHKELRIHAEAVTARRREQRMLRREEEERSRRALDHLRRARLAPAEPHQLWATLHHLMSLARVDRRRQQLVRKVMLTVQREIPAFCSSDQLPWYLLLSSQPWVRSPESFRPPPRGAWALRDALAEHLFAEWPVPEFLYRGLDTQPLAVARVPVEDEWAVRLLAHVGRGRSVYALVGSPTLPMPLTRRMCHLLCGTGGGVPPVEALRMAQVLGWGGPRDLVDPLMQTRLGRLHGPDPNLGEPFWHGVIAWLCRSMDGNVSVPELEATLGWIEGQQRVAISKGQRFLLAGRTASSVRRQAESLQHALERTGQDAFPSSGLLPLSVGGWEIAEVSDGPTLAAEGEAMSHCVAMYAGHLKSRKVAIFSLRQDGERRATIEVALGSQAVVQAKRKANRECSPEDLAVIRQWAELNRLSIRC